jgi:diguanylate cyclase (GGDEF)-like protein
MKYKLLFLLIIITLCLGGWTNQSSPTAKKGIISLKNWDFSSNGTVPLEGEWAFYWERMEPKELKLPIKPSYLEADSTWDVNNKYPSVGYGLYHLKINGLTPGQNYGIKIPNMSASYKLWLNDQLLISNGKPGTTKETTTPFYKPQQVYFEAKDSTIHLYMTISNFHYRSGGMWDQLILGTPEQITSLTKKNLAFEAILLGSLILSGLYHFVLYIYRHKEKILLQFGAICLVIGARISVIGEQILLEFFPETPWEWIVKIEFLTFYIVVPLFSWFLTGLYPRELTKKFSQLLSFISLFFSLVVIFTPAIIYTHSLFFYQIVTIISVIFIIASLILATIRNRESTKVVLACAAFYALTVINDILHNNRMIETTNLSSLGLFVFIFSQSYILAKSSSNAFQKVEQYSTELTELNRTLEEKIYERTKSLEQSKLELQYMNEMLREMSYHDPLTGLPNRRYFDRLYEEEWDKAIKNNTMISILYLDIDHFKAYNDAYGHEQGDLTLQRVASCLKTTLSSFNGTAARIGGEEFIALLTNQNQSQTTLIAEECRLAVKGLEISHRDSASSTFVTISIGAATILPTISDSKRKLIRTADEALYYAKEEGRNQVVHAGSLIYNE